MSIKALFGCAAACSLIATAALAQESPAAPSNDVAGAQSAAPKSTNSVPAEAVTPSANVASSTTLTDPSGATLTHELIASAPVPDTPANRAKFGGPMSNAGKRTAARGN